MKVERKIIIKTDRFEIGDQIKVKFAKEKHKATAIKREDNGILFLLDDCLDRPMPMNENGGTEGGYDASDLRKYLAKKVSEIPIKLKDRMVTFENGDYLRLLTLEEVYDLNGTGGQIEWMKNRRHRITTRKGNEYAHWWLWDAISPTAFAIVTSNGFCSDNSASNAYGIRPVFKIRDLQLQSEREE